MTSDATTDPVPIDESSTQTAADCPVCGGVTAVEESLPDVDIRRRLGRVFGAPPPPEVTIGDYDLRRCQACDLVFADPMAAGTDSFYGWVTGFERYHSGARWEWRKVKELLEGPAHQRVLELGCGKGDLLEMLAGPTTDAFGLDISEASIAKAQARGLNAEVGSHAEIGENFGDRRFDAVILSHVLEHIGDPRGLMADLKPCLNPGGRIFVAVPYSPMSLEILHNNIMNLPPHHMSRWNSRSLARLAQEAGATLTLHTRGPKSPLKRAWHFTWVSVTDEEIGVPGWRRIAIVAGHPGRFVRLLRKSFGRERVNGRIAPDEVLAEFRIE